jgi:hypothetical protein
VGAVVPFGPNQVHDYEPGIADNGLFWTVAIPPNAVSFDLDAGTASYTLTNYAIPDWTNFANAVAGGPNAPATVSFDMRWLQKGQKFRVDKADQKFIYDFFFTQSTIEFSSEQEGFSFVSDPADPALSQFASVGYERNGVFYDKPYAAPPPTTTTTTSPPSSNVGAANRGRLPATGTSDRRALLAAAALGAATLLRRRASVEAQRVDDFEVADAAGGDKGRDAGHDDGEEQQHR